MEEMYWDNDEDVKLLTEENKELAKKRATALLSMMWETEDKSKDED